MSLDDALFWGTVAFIIFGGALWATGRFWPEPKKPASTLESIIKECR